MKLVLATAAVSAMSLMSVGVAHAAFASYDFENATVNAGPSGGVGPINLGSDVPFSTGLAALGVTSSTLSGGGIGATTGQRGVYCNNNNQATCTPGAMNPPAGANTTINFGSKSFGIGNTGETWTLVFGGGGIDSFTFAFNESEVVGFTVTAFGLDGTTPIALSNGVYNPTATASSPCQFASTCNTLTVSGGVGVAIGKIQILDRAAPGSPTGGDGLQVDNLSVNTLTAPTPEPSTYLMIGSALAGLATFRRRRA